MKSRFESDLCYKRFICHPTNNMGTAILYSGNDTIDARIRLNNAVVDDVILAGTGDDRVYGGSGNDTLRGEAGNDTLWGGIGNDKLDGGEGNDLIYGEAGADLLKGGNGVDWLDGGAGNDIFSAGAGNDTVVGGSGTDTATLFDTFSSLKITKTAAGFSVESAANGVDTLTGVERVATNDGTFAWNAVTNSWAKVSTVAGWQLSAEAFEIVTGTAGADTITENFGPTTSPRLFYNLLDGNDSLTFLSGTFGNVAVFAGNGDDKVEAINTSSGNIRTSANGLFYFDGGAGNDTLIGGRFSDTLLGGDGNDIIAGGEGNDVMWGGTGSDTFTFASTRTGSRNVDTYYTPPGNDVIKDFQIGVDKLAGGINTTITDTAAGLVVSSSFLTQTGGFAPIYGIATALLEGVHGNYTIADLFV